MYSQLRGACMYRSLALFAMFLIMPMATTPDADPYLWLEDVTGDKALGWVRQRNVESTGELAKTAEFQALNARLLSILDSQERIPVIEKRGARYYNFWRDEQNQRGLWRRTTLEEYRKTNPAWETVLDVDALARAEHENWVWQGAVWLEPDDDRALVKLSRGGADASVVREFDPRTRAFVADGFVLPEAKSDLAWKNRDTLLVGTDFGPGSLTDSGYPRMTKEWKRGTTLEAATVVYEGEKADVGVFATSDRTPGFERDLVTRAVTFWKSDVFLRRSGVLIEIDKPRDADSRVHREWLLLTLRTRWQAGGADYPAGALLACNFEAFLAGERRCDVLFAPSERTALAAFSPTRRQIILNQLDNVNSRISLLTHTATGWMRDELPALPTFGSASASAVDPYESDDYFITVENFVTPVTLALGGVAGGSAPESLKRAPVFFNSEGLAISQHEATSKDGTKVPYFQVSRQRPAPDGNAPTLLYGYGGFEVSLTPAYDPLVGAAWLESGGVFAVANIRGGGEFGPKWHQAALKQNRLRAYEDFAAVAEDLVTRKVTSRQHLGIQGGSNGGLLTGNMLTRYPELFGAVVCQVPLLDMRRYHTLLAGASWMAEYGNPDDPKEWEFIQAFSPYENLKKDVQYPPVLFTTSTRDDRVHPGHARKMTARMKEMGKDALYYENVEGGHGGAADNKQRAFMDALAYTFLWKQLK
jgi:prolyl oligopeptidase